MQIFLLTFLVLCLAVFGMSLGMILNKRELKGSCGGIANIPGMKSDCSCSNPCEKRKARMQKAQQEQQEYARINIDLLSSSTKKPTK
ncbi:MAG: Unknown protein [uncultured Thiotrichaceae bacterium]|uniref:(Na+)-NQR maturation NqrM n=1 Tax=uncultured Thiotrichaceae bacterium TaxID=298394 RepID=A0A6S6TQ54_9GAMM|nr:MAG: Unknown protein [uncultured Thiotrichaceae bacterium]